MNHIKAHGALYNFSSYDKETAIVIIDLVKKLNVKLYVPYNSLIFKLAKDMIIALRPGDGISPMEIPNLVGRTFNKNLRSSEKITYEDFEE